MIAGSWFEKAEMVNRMMERRLRGQYVELQERQHLKRSKGIYYMWFRTGYEELIAFVDGKGRVHMEKGYAISWDVWTQAHAVPGGQGRKKTDVTKTESDKKLEEVVVYSNSSGKGYLREGCGME